MMQQSKKELLFLFLLNLIFCLCYFYPIIGRLNTIMMSASGDGIKNYFNYLYFIQYDYGSHFTGMNYPFGEHIIFTDNMPALAWPLAKLRNWFPGIVHYGLFLMHLTFIVSYFLCSLFIYRILSLYRVRGWWAVAAAIFIAYFSPQFFRLFGHFGLGLCCFFPMILYWIMQYERQRKGRYLVYITLHSLLFTLLHVYYLAFSLILILGYCFAYLVSVHRPLKRKLAYCFRLSMAVGAAIALFKLYLFLTDPVTDRPAYPSGYLTSGATFMDIATSYYNFIGSSAFAWIFGGSAHNTEGYCYLGFVSLLVLLFLIYRLLRSLVVRIVRRRKVAAHPVRSFRTWLITALVVFMFAMGIPFIWGMDFLADYVSVFRQFRTLGRFSWITYYILMIYAAIFLYRWFSRMQRRGFRKTYLALTAVVCIIWLIEWNGYGQTIREECNLAAGHYTRFRLEGDTTWTTWLQEKGFSVDSFQGTIGLPYTHIGSEKVGMQEDYSAVIYTGAQIACQTGLRMTDVMMSRTSWSQSFANLRLCDGPLSGKPIADQFGDKPFLLFVQDRISLIMGERHLVQQASFIGHREGVDLYRLDLKAMEQHDQLYRDSLRDLAMIQTQTEGLIGGPGFSYHNAFDNSPYEKPFAGKGAFPATPAEEQLLASVPVSHPTTDSLFTISAWFHCYDNSIMPAVLYRQFDKNNQQIAEDSYPVSSTTFVTHMWFKADKEFKLLPQTTRMAIYVLRGPKSYKAMDNLLIYPSRAVYFDRSGPVLMLNNRPIDDPLRP
ncbi:glycosyltransferase family protein [Taibaiella helva]|uniref:hypothetical protein n=1 Tax=Taibaiella helva TaxID=2301235 RepID=UPI000E58A3EE|nr:hypothetical protein [Taibaiella helva]